MSKTGTYDPGFLLTRSGSTRVSVFFKHTVGLFQSVILNHNFKKSMWNIIKNFLVYMHQCNNEMIALQFYLE